MGTSGLGVDRVSVVFPVGTVNEGHHAWGSSSVELGAVRRRSWSGRVRLAPDVWAFVGARELPETRSTWAKVEFNPSRVVDPAGASLVPPGEVIGLVAYAVGMVADLVEAVEPVEDARVKRVDVARDFEEVDSASFFVRGLAPLRRPWARKSFLYNDPARGMAETLCVGGKSSEVRLYDKSREARTRGVPEGVLRWEVQARGDWAKSYGQIERLRDLTTEKVTALGRNRWEWSAMGCEVTATDRVVEKVMRSNASPAVQRGFLGHLLLQSRGVASPLSNDTATKFNRMQRELNVVLSSQTFEGVSGAGFVSRLDWETGREVLRVA